MERYREGIYVRKKRKGIKEKNTKNEYLTCGAFTKGFYFLSIYAILVY
jgi:hypothetical protein